MTPPSSLFTPPSSLFTSTLILLTPCSGKLYNTLQQQWSSSLKKEITVDSPQCNAVTLITPPALVSSPVPISATEAYGAIMVDNSIIPIILACLIMVVGPVLLVFNCVRPEPLTSFGRGFDYTIHSNLRSFLGLNALCLFVVVLNAWTAYGMNGNAIELLMLEVNGLTAFIGMQLGEASGSLAQALNQTNYLNTEYEKHEGGFYRNEYCPAQIGGNAITDDQCYAALKAYPNFLTKYAAGQIVSPREAAAYRYGGPPGALMGDYMFCPMPADMANPTGPEITEFTFCLTQLVVFYNMGHALAGYPGEGRVFEPDLTITCCRLGKCVDVDGEFAVANSETHTCTQGLKAPFLVSSEITRLLTTLDTEAKNSESYSELGKQMIETIMRLRQVMVYFMMQVRARSQITRPRLHSVRPLCSHMHACGEWRPPCSHTCASPPRSRSCPRPPPPPAPSAPTRSSSQAAAGSRSSASSSRSSLTPSTSPSPS